MADGYVGAAVDRDGDVWGQREFGVWRCLTEDAGKFETAELVETYGPLRFTEASDER